MQNSERPPISFSEFKHKLEWLLQIGQNDRDGKLLNSVKTTDGVKEKIDPRHYFEKFYDETEITGETPPDYVPGVTHIDSKEKDEKLPGLKKWAEEHGKEALIIGTAVIGVATAVTLVVIGREAYLKHLKKDK